MLKYPPPFVAKENSRMLLKLPCLPLHVCKGRHSLLRHISKHPEIHSPVKYLNSWIWITNLVTIPHSHSAIFISNNFCILNSVFTSSRKDRSLIRIQNPSHLFFQIWRIGLVLLRHLHGNRTWYGLASTISRFWILIGRWQQQHWIGDFSRDTKKVQTLKRFFALNLSF